MHCANQSLSCDRIMSHSDDSFLPSKPSLVLQTRLLVV